MTALNQTSELWTSQLLHLAAVGTLPGAGEAGSDQPGPTCCYLLCHICCWVVC
jgi:hypothetical protein